MSNTSHLAELHDNIVAHDLTKSFGAVRAVRGLDLSLQRGSTVALLGPNGAGKTTTIDMLIGLTKPDAGTVSLFGRTPREAVKAGMIGAMTQTGQLIDYLTVRELVTMMAAIYPAPLDVEGALRISGADEFADRIVLMSRGRIVADGAPTEIKATVGGRIIRATLPDVELLALHALPGVTMVDRKGDAITLNCSNSDATLRELLRTYPLVRDIEVRGAGLEEAFLELTVDDEAP